MREKTYKLYESILVKSEQGLFEDRTFHLTIAVDSNVAGVQVDANTQMKLDTNTRFLKQLSQFPGPTSAYLRLNALQVLSAQLASDVVQTKIQFDYVDQNGLAHPVLLWDSKAPQIEPVLLMRAFSASFQDPGSDLGSFQATVLAEDAGAAHIVTYHLLVSVSFLYRTEEESRSLFPEIDKTHAAVVEAHGSVKEVKKLLHDVEKEVKKVPEHAL